MTKKRTIVEHMIERGATTHEALQMLEFMVGYGLAEDKAGGPIKIEDYCEFVGIHRAQGFRRLRLWREFCTDESDATPSRAWQSMPRQVKRAPRPLAVFLAATTVRVVDPKSVDG